MLRTYLLRHRVSKIVPKKAEIFANNFETVHSDRGFPLSYLLLDRIYGKLALLEDAQYRQLYNDSLGVNCIIF